MSARNRTRLLFGLAVVALVVSNVYAEDEIDEEEPVPHSVKVESCAGWRLNKLPEVKKFITEDLEGLFLNTEFKKIPGKSPEMIFYNQFGEEIERMDISNLVRSELVALLDKKGIARRFQKKVILKVNYNTKIHHSKESSKFCESWISRPA